MTKTPKWTAEVHGGISPWARITITPREASDEKFVVLSVGDDIEFAVDGRTELGRVAEIDGDLLCILVGSAELRFRPADEREVPNERASMGAAQNWIMRINQ
jgi:hypothetical protein